MRVLKFHPDYIRSLMASKDVYDYNLGADIDSRIQLASVRLGSPDYALSLPLVRRLPNRMLRLPRTWEDKLLIRHVNRKICRIYKINPPNRHTIVSQVASLLRSDVTLRIIRTDIKSFFDNANIDRIIQQILKAGRLRQREDDVLCAIRDSWNPRGGTGLPWGVSLSSTLAELILADFDRSVVRTPGVLYFRRFVDDIVVIAPSRSAFSCAELENLLPEGLSFGPNKTSDLTETLVNDGSIISEFDYLGYRFFRTLRKKSGATAPKSRRRLPRISFKDLKIA